MSFLLLLLLLLLSPFADLAPYEASSSFILGKGVIEIECLGEESAEAEIALLLCLRCEVEVEECRLEWEDDRGGGTSPSSPAVDELGDRGP